LGLLAVAVTAGVVAIVVTQLSKPSLGPLIDQLDGPSREGKVNALHRLAKMGPQAQGALAAIDRCEKGSDVALTNLARACRYLIDPRDRFADKNTSAMRFIGGDQGVIEGLLAMAESQDSELAARGLGILGFKLCELLPDPNGVISVRLQTPEAEQAVGVLASRLGDPALVVRQSAAMSLAIISTRSSSIPAFSWARAALEKAQKDADPMVRGYARMALGAGGPADPDARLAAEDLRRRTDAHYDY
jgi:hypothetical protein